MFMKLKYSNVPIWYIWYIRINSTDLIKSDYVDMLERIQCEIKEKTINNREDLWKILT